MRIAIVLLSLTCVAATGVPCSERVAVQGPAVIDVMGETDSLAAAHAIYSICVDEIETPGGLVEPVIESRLPDLMMDDSFYDYPYDGFGYFAGPHEVSPYSVLTSITGCVEPIILTAPCVDVYCTPDIDGRPTWAVRPHDTPGVDWLDDCSGAMLERACALTGGAGNGCTAF